jgi:DNA-binding NarL/FixJ family response regulator
MPQPPSDQKPNTRIGDMPAMLRLMGPLHGPVPDPVESRRRLVADLCRFIGTKIGTLPAEGIDKSAVPQPVPPDLSPRLSQTLQLLLTGDSEKQVANKLRLSRHTVHVYVKALYRRYDVSTRAELLARHFKR